MAKFSLVINSDDPGEISRALAAINGSPLPMPPPNGGGADADDETGGTVADASVTVDRNGIPWDERIHSTNKVLNSDGTWRKRRGVQDHVVAAVETELRARTAAPPPAVAAPPPMAPPPAPTVVAAPPAPPPMAPPPAPTVVAAPPPANAAPTIDFNALMLAIQASMNANKIDTAFVAWMSAQLGVPAMTALASDPIKVGQAYELMRQQGRLVG